MSSPDCLVIGSGPVGLECAAALHRAGRRVRVLEAEMLAASIFKWPARTRFLSGPERVAIAGVPIQTSTQEPVTRETYLAYLRAVVELCDLDVRTFSPVRRIRSGDCGPVVETGGSGTKEHEATCVVIATGRLARPRRLDVPGGDLPHVYDRLDEPHRHFGRHVLVVGAGNGGLGTASRLWRCGARVTLAHRSDEIDADAVRPEVHADVRMLIDKGCIDHLPGVDVASVDETSVTLAPRGTGSTRRLDVDVVLTQIGYEPDNGWMGDSGIRLDGGAPAVDRDTMATSVSGVYAVGTVVERSNDATAISHGRDHVRRLVEHLTGERPRVGGAADRVYPFSFGDDEAPARPAERPDGSESDRA